MAELENLEQMSLVELRLAGRKMGVKNVTTYKKMELLEKLKEIRQQEDGKEKQADGESTNASGKEGKKGNASTTAKTVESENQKNENKRERSEHAGNRKRNGREDKAVSGNRETEQRSTAAEKRSHPAERSERHRSSQENERREHRQNNGGYSGNYNNSGSNTHNNNSGAHSNAGAYGNNNHGGSYHRQQRMEPAYMTPEEYAEQDSGETKQGILEIMSEGFGFIRCDNYLPGEGDVYVSPAMIRRFQLRSGDILVGNTKIRTQTEKFSALLYIKTVNGYSLEQTARRNKFENLTPVFPNERIHLEVPGSNNISMRMMDLISPIGKGQRGMIVSQPKTGKTTLLKQVARSVKMNHPHMHLIVLLIDERPEEVTDIRESIQGPNVEVIYSTFDELPENHKRVSEMVIERAKRLVEHGEDVMILLDSITRLARAYNLTVQPSGRTLSGGLDPAALYMPKRFFGAARNMREGGSLTILATALVDTGSKMDDVVFEEFKGTGNMELVLDRSLSEKRLFPAIDLPKSSTRRDDLLLSLEESEANFLMRKAFNSSRTDEAVEKIIQLFRKTKDNKELIQTIKKVKIL